MEQNPWHSGLDWSIKCFNHHEYLVIVLEGLNLAKKKFSSDMYQSKKGKRLENIFVSVSFLVVR